MSVLLLFKQETLQQSLFNNLATSFLGQLSNHTIFTQKDRECRVYLSQYKNTMEMLPMDFAKLFTLQDWWLAKTIMSIAKLVANQQLKCLVCFVFVDKVAEGCLILIVWTTHLCVIKMKKYNILCRKLGKSFRLLEPKLSLKRSVSETLHVATVRRDGALTTTTAILTSKMWRLYLITVKKCCEWNSTVAFLANHA